MRVIDSPNVAGDARIQIDFDGGGDTWFTAGIAEHAQAAELAEWMFTV